MREHTRGDKLARRVERYEREADRGLAERDAATATVQRETALTWIDRLYAERIANAIAGQREEAVREIDAAEASYRGGRGAQADVFAARSALIALEDKLADAQNRVRVAGEALARWIGEAAFGPIAGAIDLKSLPPHVAG